MSRRVGAVWSTDARAASSTDMTNITRFEVCAEFGRERIEVEAISVNVEAIEGVPLLVFYGEQLKRIVVFRNWCYYLVVGYREQS
jgi:hypothetical protein